MLVTTHIETVETPHSSAIAEIGFVEMPEASAIVFRYKSSHKVYVYTGEHYDTFQHIRDSGSLGRAIAELKDSRGEPDALTDDSDKRSLSEICNSQLHLEAIHGACHNNWPLKPVSRSQEFFAAINATPATNVPTGYQFSI